MLSKILKGILVVILVVAVGGALIYYTGLVAGRTYEERVAAETNEKVDVYKMQNYAHENAEMVLKALKKSDTDKIQDNMRKPADLTKLMNYADWKDLDIKCKTSFGTGSFMPKPDKKGRMDVGEQIMLKAGNTKYVIYVQTLTSRCGKIDEGITCIAVTTFKHFDEIDYAWLWQTDSSTLRAGKAFY